ALLSPASRRLLRSFLFQAEDGIRDRNVTGVQTCALPIFRDAVDHLDQVVDAPGVHGHAQAQLGLGLVALGDGDPSHVVPEAGELQRVHLGPAGGGAGPAADLGLHAPVARVTDHGLAVDAQAGGDVAELAVAVRGLVQVHEIHV